MDIIGPLPLTPRQSRYILVCVDYFTRWPEAFPLSEISAFSVASVFSSHWLSRYGAPEQLHTDQGSQFESSLIANLCRIFNIRKSRTTPYHPQSDGLVERFNKTLKASLRAYASNTSEWDLHLPYVLMAYRTAVQKSTDFTPAMLFLGRELRLPTDIVYAIPNSSVKTVPEDFAQHMANVSQQVFRLARQNSDVAHKVQKDQYDRRSHGKPFSVDDTVWLLRPGIIRKSENPWSGPYTVTHAQPPVYTVQRLPDGPSQNVHFNRLKRCYDTPTLHSAETPVPASADASPMTPDSTTFTWPSEDCYLQPPAVLPANPHQRRQPPRHAGLPGHLRDYVVYRV